MSTRSTCRRCRSWASRAAGRSPCSARPTGEPFWGGTYFPPSRALRPAELRRRAARRGAGLSREAAGRRDQPRRPAARRCSEGRQQGGRVPGRRAAVPARRCSTRSPSRIVQECDLDWGGFGQAPKFPSPYVFELLWRGWLRDRDNAQACATPSPSRSTACARAASTIISAAASRATPPTTNG